MLHGQIGCVDSELGGAVLVADQKREFVVVGADGLVVATEGVVAGGFGGGGALGQGDLGAAQVERGVGVGVGDQAVAVGVVDVGGGLGAGLAVWLGHLAEAAFSVPDQCLLVACQGAGEGVARIVGV